MNQQPSYRVLVVEDNPLQVQLVQDLFGLVPNGNITAVCAMTLADALNELQTSSFDVVLLDLSLPDSSGIDTFRQLHAFSPDSPIVIWSGESDETVALSAMREGAQEYLPKTDVSPAQLVRTIRYIIERSRAERSAQAERHRLSIILDSTPDCVKLLDRAGIVTRMNEAGLALLEADREEVIGKSMLDFVLEPHHRAVKEMLRRVFDGESVEAEYEMRTTSGSIRWVSSRAVPLREANDDIDSLLAITRDVTIQKHTEQALLESEEYFRLLVENLTDIVALVDPAFAILYISPVCEQILGYKPESVVGDSAWDYVHPDDVPALQRRALERMQGDDRPVVSEVRMRHLDGRWRYVQMRARPYTAGRYGDPALLITIRDVTEAKRIEEDLRFTQEQLLHVQKLEAVGRLAGGVAHDFNNLLTAIGGHSDLLLEEIGANQAARAEVEEIKHSVERAASLTRQLLAFSRKQVMQPVVLDLHTVVSDMRRLLGRLIGENIELITSAMDSTATTRADRGQIEQVIMNLVVNSRDAMPQGGRVTVSTGGVRVTTERPHPSQAPPGEYAELVVSDTGTGMTKEVLAHIFEPFFTTKDVGKGTGLGLATVYGIVKQSGGYIHVASRPGAGTTFELLFPFVEDTAHKQAGMSSRTRSGAASGTILIVEDEKSVRDVACRVLKRAGYEVLPASDGVEALQIGEAWLENLDLVVTDVMMPRLNGPDLVSRLRALRPEIRVLFTSGYTGEDLFQNGDELDFLEKPFTPASLLEAVARVISA